MTSASEIQLGFEQSADEGNGLFLDGLEVCHNNDDNEHEDDGTDASS